MTTVDRETEARAVIRIPYALTGVIGLLTINFLAMIWLGGSFQAEMRSGLTTLEVGQREQKQKIEALADRMYTQADALRDREVTARTLHDHEGRIRELERGRGKGHQ